MSDRRVEIEIQHAFACFGYAARYEHVMNTSSIDGNDDSKSILRENNAKPMSKRINNKTFDVATAAGRTMRVHANVRSNLSCQSVRGTSLPVFFMDAPRPGFHSMKNVREIYCVAGIRVSDRTNSRISPFEPGPKNARTKLPKSLSFGAHLRV